MSYEIVQIFDSVLGPSSQQNKEHLYYCPLCHHPKKKLSVNFIKRVWKCWACGKAGQTLLGLLRRLDVSRDQVATLSRLLGDEVPRVHDETPDVALVLPREFEPLISERDSIAHLRALEYVLSRGVTEEDILRYNIGVCPSGMFAGRVIIPSYDEDGTLNYFCSRDFTGQAKFKYMNPPVSKNVIGFDSHINWDYPIVIVEGYFDAMATQRNASPLTGKTLSKKLQKKIIERGVRDVYLALDADALRDTIKIAEHYLNQGITVWIVGLNGKDPSVIGASGMHRLIKDATKLSFGDLMKLKLKLC